MLRVCDGKKQLALYILYLIFKLGLPVMGCIYVHWGRVCVCLGWGAKGGALNRSRTKVVTNIL